MLNQIILVGKIERGPELIIQENKKVETEFILKIHESTEKPILIPVTLWQGISKTVLEHCKKDTTLGIKARLGLTDDNLIKILAEKITFITSKKEDQ